MLEKLLFRSHSPSQRRISRVSGILMKQCFPPCPVWLQTPLSLFVASVCCGCCCFYGLGFPTIGVESLSLPSPPPPPEDGWTQCPGSELWNSGSCPVFSRHCHDFPHGGGGEKGGKEKRNEQKTKRKEKKRGKEWRDEESFSRGHKEQKIGHLEQKMSWMHRRTGKGRNWIWK